MINKNLKIISIVNQKGGVGKTTTAMNLATALCALNLQVLLLDLDPQANATSGLGISWPQFTGSSYDLLIGTKKFIDVVYQTLIPNLFIVPSVMDLAGADIELADMERKEFYLQQALQQVEGFDYIIIDCPPSLSLLTVNALVASQEVLIPLQCEYFALEGLGHLVKTINTINISLNKELKIKGILLTMYDIRNNLSKSIAEDVRSYYKDLVYNTLIPRNVKISEAPSHGYPVLMYDPKCAGSKAYISLAVEVVRQDNKLKNQQVKNN